MTAQGPRVVHVPRNQVPHYRAAGYVDLSGVGMAGAQTPMPAAMPQPQSRFAGCLPWLIIGLCGLLLLVIGAGSVVVMRSRQQPAETASSISQRMTGQGSAKAEPRFIAAPLPTPFPTSTPIPVHVVSGGPGTYQCQMCEAEHGCSGFRSGSPMAFGGGAEEVLGWVSFTPTGDTTDITTSGPFGVEAVYRGCRKIGN